jgi:hypothetical protein
MSYSSEVLADAPIAYYRLAEASGNIQDSSGGARHGDEVHAAPTYQATGPILSDSTDKAMTIHSSGPDWFHIPWTAGWDIGDVGTLEIWIKRADSATTEQVIVTRDQSIYIGLINSRLFIAKSGVAGIAQSTTTITDTTTWHHCVVTKNAGTVKQYIDTVDVTGTVTNSTWANTVTTGISIGADAGGTPYNGGLDEVAVYGTALSSARVTAHYNAAFGQLLLPDADVAAGGWTTSPLFSKVNDSSDATIITATAA